MSNARLWSLNMTVFAREVNNYQTRKYGHQMRIWVAIHWLPYVSLTNQNMPKEI